MNELCAHAHYFTAVSESKRSPVRMILLCYGTKHSALSLLSACLSLTNVKYGPAGRYCFSLANLEAYCVVCDTPGSISDQLFCTSCGQHYHGNCLDPTVEVNPVVRAGWQCPECKICQTCRYLLLLLSNLSCTHHLILTASEFCVSRSLPQL